MNHAVISVSIIQRAPFARWDPWFWLKVVKLAKSRNVALDSPALKGIFNYVAYLNKQSGNRKLCLEDLIDKAVNWHKEK